MHLRAAEASPRGSLSSTSSSANPASGNVARVGGSDDDILGLGNLFLPRRASGDAAPIPPPAASVHPVGGGSGEGMPLVAGLTAYRSTMDAGRANVAPSAHHSTNLSLTDDIKSALRIGEADPAVAAARRSAAMEATATGSSNSSTSALFRQMEQQQQHLLQQRPIRPPPFPTERGGPQIGAAPRGAVRLTATQLRGGSTTLPTGPPMGPAVVLPEPRQSVVRMPDNSHLPTTLPQ